MNIVKVSRLSGLFFLSLTLLLGPQSFAQEEDETAPGQVAARINRFLDD